MMAFEYHNGRKTKKANGSMPPFSSFGRKRVVPPLGADPTRSIETARPSETPGSTVPVSAKPEDRPGLTKPAPTPDVPRRGGFGRGRFMPRPQSTDRAAAAHGVDHVTSETQSATSPSAASPKPPAQSVAGRAGSGATFRSRGGLLSRGASLTDVEQRYEAEQVRHHARHGHLSEAKAAPVRRFIPDSVTETGGAIPKLLDDIDSQISF